MLSVATTASVDSDTRDCLQPAAAATAAVVFVVVVGSHAKSALSFAAVAVLSRSSGVIDRYSRSSNNSNSHFPEPTPATSVTFLPCSQLLRQSLSFPFSFTLSPSLTNLSLSQITKLITH